MIFKICYQFHKFLTLVFTSKSIKFGNYTCLPRSIVEKMINEKATWNSFSGSLKKIENNLIPIPSIRGNRYFGPSKMSFINLIKHSLSIISVFRKTFLIRSALFIIIYILMIKSNASIITAIPLIFLLIDKALARIREDTYGYCLDTAEPIGLKRLMARPVAKYTIAAQEKHEKDEKVHADD